MTDISFEFFPPKTITAAFSLQRAAQTLSMLAPHFGSVTCSHNPTQTLDTLAALDKLALGPFQAHITCASQDNNQLPQYLRAAKRAGAKGIFALRGDGKSQGLTV